VTRLSALENVLIGSLGRLSGWRRSWVRCFPAAEIAHAEAALHAVGLLARAQTRGRQAFRRRAAEGRHCPPADAAAQT
jgi:ABC-type phosphate/phosphonate transport system ATPase subunit